MNKIKNHDIKKIKNGDLFIFPTETVLGLGVIYGADTKNIYEIKGRDFKKPLSLHLTKDLNYLQFWRNNIPEWMKQLIIDITPGPYTFIYYKNDNLLHNFPFEKIGLRFPDDKTFINLISQLERPIWGTSANLSGSLAIVKISDLPLKMRESVSCMIHGTESLGKESTVVDLTENELDKMILRTGAGDVSLIEKYWRNK